MYNMDSIGSAMMLIFDELKNDKQSKALIKKIDEATSDSQVRSGIRAGVKRLRELDKNALANDIEKKTKGFAF
jgi:hypothetical protein